MDHLHVSEHGCQVGRQEPQSGSNNKDSLGAKAAPEDQSEGYRPSCSDVRLFSDCPNEEGQKDTLQDHIVRVFAVTLKEL